MENCNYHSQHPLLHCCVWCSWVTRGTTRLSWHCTLQLWTDLHTLTEHVSKNTQNALLRSSSCARFSCKKESLRKNSSTCATIKPSNGVEESIENRSPERRSPILHAAHTRPAVYHRVVTVDRPHAQRAVETTNGIHAPTHVHHTLGTGSNAR